MLRNVILMLLCALSAPVVMAAGPTPKAADSKTGLAIELMQATHYERNMQAMQSQIRTLMQAQFAELEECAAAKPVMREFADAVTDKLNATLMSEDLKVDIAALYAEVFNEEELREITEFYRSPLGRKMLDRMPELMQKSMQVSQERMKPLMPELKKLGGEYAERIQKAGATCSTTDAAEKKEAK
jgi:hypothetical protein